MTYHIPVMSAESIEGLNIRPDGVYVDLTFGGGGHSRAILEQLGERGKLLVFDQDFDAEGNVPADKRVTFIHANFRYLRNFLEYYSTNKVDGILADLGISSHQIDKPERGFTYMSDTFLDMRMNKLSGKTAADILNEYSEGELQRVFRDYGEVSNYRALTGIIIRMRQERKISLTKSFISGIEAILPQKNSYSVLSKIFQALRIEVNDELGALREMLLQLPDYLKPQGRVVVLTYHSLEDRMVKNFFRSGNLTGNIEKDFFGNPQVPFRLINRSPIIPDKKEIEKNVRARSAKLRIAEKL